MYATPQQHDTVTYALDIGANITDFFTNYFGLPYPLPKQDMIAIPDFVSGAMEHWGLITYRYHGTLGTYHIQVSWNIGDLLFTSIIEHWGLITYRYNGTLRT